MSSELKVLALAIQMGIPDETDRNLMPMPYVGIHADCLGAAIRKDSLGSFLEGITMSGHLYNVAKEAKEFGDDMVNQLKLCLHNTDKMIKNDNYTDVPPYLQKSKTPAEAAKLVSKCCRARMPACPIRHFGIRWHALCTRRCAHGPPCGCHPPRL